MSQIQDDDENLTFPVAKGQLEKRIVQLRKGDKSERRVAEQLARCRAGNRCNLLECPVCERRKQLPKWQAPANLVKSVIGISVAKKISLDRIRVVGERRALNKEKVREIAASMEQLGLQIPITIRTQEKELILVSGWHRLAAAKRLGWDSILSVELRGGKTDARLWQIVENLCRSELTVLERAEQVDELRALVRTRTEEGQVAPPGGRQPKESGIKKSAKALGLTREQIRRSRDIARLSPKAKAKVRKLGLDDNQRALLTIAKQPTPKTQLRALKDFVERKRAARMRNGVGDEKTTDEISTLEADIADKEDALEGLQSELAADRKQLRDIQDTLAVQDDPTLEQNPLEEESEQKQSPAAASQTGSDNSIEDIPSPATALTEDEGIPCFLDRRPLSPDNQRIFDALLTMWDSSGLPTLLRNAPAVVHDRFFAKVRADISSLID